MSKVIKKTRDDVIVKCIEKKFGMPLKCKTDTELHAGLIRDGLPSLSKLLKMVHGTK